MESDYVTLCGREVHVTCWGPPKAPPVVMWHGLARTARDFDDLAAALSGRYRIVCPDTIGRGLSEWSSDPEREYCLGFYAGLAAALVERLGLSRVRWVGTSMGGAIGVRAAATTLKGRIERLLINDLGPTLPAPAVERIRTYVAAPPSFPTMTAFQRWMELVYEPFGPHTPEQWRRMAENQARRLPNGRLTPHYDPAIVQQFFTNPADYEQWPYWDGLDVPCLVLRGTRSDLLLPDVAAEMARRNTLARIVEIDGVGHAPALNVPAQFEIVAQFLAG